ncbi:MAG: hypothetical protein ACI4YB_06950 [Oscillospiraceae bacterium]
MTLVPAICTQCGSKLEVDPGKEAAICPYCKTPFITQKAINHYSTTNVTNIDRFHAEVVNMTDDSSRDNRVKAGETFISLNDYVSAEKIFGELTKDCPYDYRGWWGLIRVYSVDFSDMTIDGEILSRIAQFYQNAIAVASIDEQKAIEPQYEAYYNSVREKLDALLLDTQTKIKNLETEFNRYKRDHEDQINHISEQKKKIISPSVVLAIVILVIVGISAVCGTIESGLGVGILAFIIFGAIGKGIHSLIGRLIDIPSNRAREEMDAKIAKLTKELSDYTNKYTEEINRLNTIIQKAR